LKVQLTTCFRIKYVVITSSKPHKIWSVDLQLCLHPINNLHSPLFIHGVSRTLGVITIRSSDRYAIPGLSFSSWLVAN